MTMTIATSILPLLLILQPSTGSRRADLYDSLFLKAQQETTATASTHGGTTTTTTTSAAKHNVAPRHAGRRAMLDSSVRSEAQRQLAELPVTEFCSNLDSIAMYSTDRLMELFPETTFLTEEEQYVCSCIIHDGGSLDVVCGTFYMVETFSVSPNANLDYMQLKLGEDATYTPQSVGWCEYLEGSYEGATYCEDFVLDSEDPSKLASCFIRDDTCRVEHAPECQVCERGQSVSLSSGDNCYNVNVTCEENYMGPWIYEYHVASPIQVIADEPVSCVDAPTFGEFCKDLSEIEMTITEAFRDFQPDLEIIPYECSCLASNSSFALSCETNYFDFVYNITHRSTEVMVFSEQNGYSVPGQMQWCDFNVDDSSDFYCKSFEFALLQNELSFCESGDCGAGFCELCSDGLSVGSTCFSNNTCSESIPGAFLFAYKDTKLAVEQCSVPSPPTDAPVASPIITDAPVEGPTMAPVGSPTTAPVNSPTPAPVDGPTIAPVEDPTPAPVDDEPTDAPVEETLPPTESKAIESNGFVIVVAILAATVAQIVF
jgi:hypothetical protein